MRVLTAIVLGQFTCGFSLGITGGALTNAAKYIQISDMWIGLIGAGGLIGLSSSALIGRLSDKIGRSQLLMSNMYILAILSLLHPLTSSLALTFLIRIGIGLMMAIDYTAGNALLTEWLPKGEDSKRQSHLLIYWVLGFIASYLTGTYLEGYGQHTWQIILATGAIPALLTALFRSFFPLPPSPGWLTSKGKIKAANRLIGRILGHKWGISRHFKRSKKQGQVSWTILFSKKYIRSTLVGGSFYACQTFAFFGISIFLPILLQGMNITNPKISGNLYNISMLIGIFWGIYLFNHLSRRFFLISNFLLSAILISVLALLPQS